MMSLSTFTHIHYGGASPCQATYMSEITVRTSSHSLHPWVHMESHVFVQLPDNGHNWATTLIRSMTGHIKWFQATLTSIGNHIYTHLFFFWLYCSSDREVYLSWSLGSWRPERVKNNTYDVQFLLLFNKLLVLLKTFYFSRRTWTTFGWVDINQRCTLHYVDNK
jgi:hypothetical protein